MNFLGEVTIVLALLSLQPSRILINVIISLLAIRREFTLDKQLWLLQTQSAILYHRFFIRIEQVKSQVSASL